MTRFRAAAVATSTPDSFSFAESFTSAFATDGNDFPYFVVYERPSRVKSHGGAARSGRMVGEKSARVAKARKETRFRSIPLG